MLISDWSSDGCSSDLLRAVAPQLYCVAMAHHAVDRADPLDLLRGDDGAAGGVLYRDIAAGMVGVPMRVPYLRDPPAPALGLVKIGLGIGCVDRSGFPAFRIVDEIAVIVRQAGELMNL